MARRPRIADAEQDELPRVIALEDKGRVLDRPTRWNPRRVRCVPVGLPDAEVAAKDYVVKFCRSKVSTAAAISEVVSFGLLSAMGFRTLRPAIVLVGQTLSQGYRETNEDDNQVPVGEHFGTVYEEWMPVDGKSLPIGLLSRPSDLVDIWVADCILLNIDREVFGNILLEPVSGKWRAVPADQSDCFGGSSTLASGAFSQFSKKTGSVARLPAVERIILDGGTKPLHEMVNRARVAAHSLPSIIARVPQKWWADAGVNREDVEHCIRDRIDRLSTIVDIDYWEGIANAITGGTVLGN